MATSEVKDKVKDIKGILTCTICLETFTNPKYLPCLHTFCESITSGFEKGKTESFECPLCRGKVQSPTKNISTEEWAKSLPMNNLISGLVEKQKLMKSEKVCMQCERMSGDTSSAARFVCIECSDTLCESCERYHRSMKVTSKHNIKPLEDLKSSDIPVSAFASYNCEVHNGRKLEFYCSEHEILCCALCVFAHHRKCENVFRLEDTVKDISKSVNELQGKLDRAQTDVSAVLKDQTDSLKTLENLYETEFRKIGDVFECLRTNLNEHEGLRKAELLKKFNEAKDQIETILVIFENGKKALDNKQKLLEVSKNESSEVNLFIEYTKLRKQADILIKQIQDKSFSLQTFQLIVDNIDTSFIEEEIKRTCSVRCDKTYDCLNLSSNNDSVMYNFNRFSFLVGSITSWTVKSKVDAVSFTVSKDIVLFGFLSYGPKDDKTCTIEASLQRDGEILTSIKTTLEDKTYEDKITKIYFQKPVAISSGVKYDIVFTIRGEGLCNYGENGRSDIDCEGLKIQFSDCSLSTNGTKTSFGQIPGFMFRKF